GMSLLEVQKITRAIARAGVHRIEPHNPIRSMIADQTTGDLRPELLGERVLSVTNRWSTCRLEASMPRKRSGRP
ncbi:MAG: hypothetical protein AB1558_01025, partial [Thermodesulfobacteriota bacterium]